MIYLGGAMTGLAGSDKKLWRIMATEFFRNRHIEVWDPVVNALPDDNPAAIIERDLSALDNCKINFVNAHWPSWGTAMEVFYFARTLDRPNVVFHPNPNAASAWLKHHAETLTSDFDEALDWAAHLYHKAVE